MQVYKRIYDNLQKGNSVIQVTITAAYDKNLIGKKLLLDNKEIFDENLPPDILEKAFKLAKITKNDGKCRLVNDKKSDGEIQFFAEKILPAQEAIIFGAGHISQALAEILNKLNFNITIIDDNRNFANSKKFPLADNIICREFNESFKILGEITSNSYVFIMTRGHLYDFLCLKNIFNYDPSYIGMIGSKKRVEKVKEKLLEAGIPREKFSSLHAPIGLDMSAETPEEIAISIAAQVIAVKNQSNIKR
jgi:xanthine dehydrogenase accessory factor